MKYKELTEKIIGRAMRVHSTMGNGFGARSLQFKRLYNKKHKPNPNNP